MDILVIAAHPDDEVLGVGGTIAKHSADGDIVHLLIVTDGSTSQYKGDPNLKKIISEKKNETQKCAEILGISTIDYGSLPDMKLDTISHVDINSCIENTIKKYKPEIVYSHFYGDINKDHRCVSESTLVAVRPVVGQCVKKVYLYRTPSSTEWNVKNASNYFSANRYVDISGFVDIKNRAIRCYTTELREFPHPRSLEAIKIIDKAAGTEIGVSAAEEFVIVREIN